MQTIAPLNQLYLTYSEQSLINDFWQEEGILYS